MDYVFLIAGSAVILTCFYFIISPFFSGTGELSESNTENDSPALELIYGAVNELEMDFLMKKINEEDFLHMKEHYQLLAADLMKTDRRPKRKAGQQDSHEEELEILQELQRLRKQKGRQ